MEPPARPEDPADPADPADPSASAEAPAPQPGKWALVRSLNQALKTYAVMPVRPGGSGRVRLGALPGLSLPVCQAPGGSQGREASGAGRWEWGAGGAAFGP